LEPKKPVVTSMAGFAGEPCPQPPGVRNAIPANRNVWSAAVLQAKNENDRIGLRECIRPLLE
jgi:hypothetical protein